MVWRELSPEDLYGLRQPLIIDVRSPCEFEEECIPGAVNIPLLSNEERAHIGTIYKNDGEFAARLKAVSLISPKIPGIISEILQLKEHCQSLVIHCWRGGLRSEAVASFLSVTGINCFRLTGGIKAWRSMVLEELRVDRYCFNPIVLHGLTGSGKTELLQELEGLSCQVLDLEGLANHRGSAFGGLGLAGQPTQKNFEAAIWVKLRGFDLSMPVFIEGESRKIGRLSVPDSILAKIRSGRAVYVESSLDARIKRIASVYLNSFQQKDEAIKASTQMLANIKERLGRERVNAIIDLLEKDQLHEALGILLTEYYDPLYRKSLAAISYDFKVSNDQVQEAAGKLYEFAQNKQILSGEDDPLGKRRLPQVN